MELHNQQKKQEKEQNPGSSFIIVVTFVTIVCREIWY